MVIKDRDGMYEIRVDKQKRLVHEIISGRWTAEDYIRFGNEYKTKIVPYLGAGNWAKLDDLNEYKPSVSVSTELQAELAKWSIANGFTCAAAILSSVTLKMQLHRSIRAEIFSGAFELEYFDNEKDAIEWLALHGF